MYLTRGFLIKLPHLSMLLRCATSVPERCQTDHRLHFPSHELRSLSGFRGAWVRHMSIENEYVGPSIRRFTNRPSKYFKNSLCNA